MWYAILHEALLGYAYTAMLHSKAESHGSSHPILTCVVSDSCPACMPFFATKGLCEATSKECLPFLLLLHEPGCVQVGP